MFSQTEHVYDVYNKDHDRHRCAECEAYDTSKVRKLVAQQAPPPDRTSVGADVMMELQRMHGDIAMMMRVVQGMEIEVRAKLKDFERALDELREDVFGE